MKAKTTAPAKKTASKAPAKKTAAKKVPTKKTAAPKRAASKPAPRADYGAPVDAFFAKQPPHLRPIVDALRALVTEVAPRAVGALKWGMPLYTLDGGMMCAIGAHKAHVNLILSGPPGAFADPQGLLAGDGKTGRHLKLTRVEELPRAAVRGWLRTAASLAAKK